MLVDEPMVAAHSRDPIMRMIADVNGNDQRTHQRQTGVYEIGHFGSSDFLRGRYEQYPELSGDDEPYRGCYGVCDGVENLLAKIPLLEASPRQFVITLTKVERDVSNRGRGGGWRWHKWGEYIGAHEPTTEYLDDEPLIDHIYVYHVYERIS